MSHWLILLIACLIPFALYGVFRAIDVVARKRSEREG